MRLKSIRMECANCHRVHDVQLREYPSSATVEGEIVHFYKYVGSCNGEYIEFKIRRLNDIAAVDAYRQKHGMLTSDDMKEIRDDYGLSQADMCVLLGWGGSTVARYEGVHIQDRCHDDLMRAFGDDVMLALNFLERSKSHFTERKYRSIRACMLRTLRRRGTAYLRERLNEAESLVRANDMLEQ